MPVPWQRLKVATTGAIATVTFAHPPVNVIDLPMMDELASVLRDLEARPEIVAIVLRGDGKAFSAGVDIAAHSSQQVPTMLARFHAVVRALVASSKVTIAIVHGSCLGGGAELALVADIVYTTLDAPWGFPEIQLACFPPVACAALAAIVGQKRATQLILTGETITGRDAMLIGLATACAPAAEVEQMTGQLIARLEQLSPAALRITKRALYAWDATHFDKGLARAEKIYLEELVPSADAHEGVQAWLAKRRPKWTGK